jgi:hypothetical protein
MILRKLSRYICRGDLARNKHMLRVAGIVIAALSALVLTILMKGLGGTQRSLSASGIDKPIPLNAKSRLIIGGWVIGLLVGVAMIVYGGQ